MSEIVVSLEITLSFTHRKLIHTQRPISSQMQNFKEVFLLEYMKFIKTNLFTKVTSLKLSNIGCSSIVLSPQKQSGRKSKLGTETLAFK